MRQTLLHDAVPLLEHTAQQPSHDALEQTVDDGPAAQNEFDAIFVKRMARPDRFHPMRVPPGLERSTRHQQFQRLGALVPVEHRVGRGRHHRAVHEQPRRSGVVAVLGTLLAGPTSYAVATRRRMAPVMNNRPAVVWAVAAAAYLLLILWGGTHALRTWWGILLLGALLAVGVAALRRESLLEFPAAEESSSP